MSSKRSIFEEVKNDATAPKAQLVRQESSKFVVLWAWILFFLIVVMIAVGGLTRLTDSGLSITEWDLVMGSLPPLSAEAWQEVFIKYQQTEEFRQINSTMTLETFKPIFWWEWGHRFLGRIIWLFWLVGFLVFVLRKQLRRDRFASLLWVGVLIALQGIVGILMVKTGYVGDRVDVASYALGFHLTMAFVIIGLIFWNIKMLKIEPSAMVEARRRGDEGRVVLAKILLVVAGIQIFLGALVAGIDGGMSYNDWPLMGGEFFSSDSFVLDPIWRNFFENSALVQFFHRMNGYLLLVIAAYVFYQTRRAPYKQWRALGLHIMIAIFLQIILGIATLVMFVPIALALLHQVFAVAIWIAVISAVFAFRYPREQTIRS